MAIYIKGMEMPYSCADCILFRECKAISRWFTKDMAHRLKEERHPNCPLVEVKEHGRLIDADAIIQQAQKYEDEGDTFYLDSAEELESYLDDEAPTIIERSKDE